MVQDEPVVQENEADARPRRASGRIALFGGVAGACVLGAGLGLWARPSDIERPAAVAAKPAAPVTPVSTDRRIPIVVDDSPAPIGKPLDVLSASPTRPAVVPRPPPRPAIHPELLAPTRPPNGLVRVTAPAPGPIAPAAASHPAQAQMQAQLRARAEAQAQARAEADRQAQAATARRQAARLAAAKAAHERAQQLAEAKAEKKAQARAERLAKLQERHEKLLAAKARAHQIELAKAAAAKPRHGLAVLTHALGKLSPHHPAPAVERAEAAPERHRKSQPHEIRLAKLAAKPHGAAATAPAAVASTARGAGSLRVANSAVRRCASSDPGETLACGDPNLGAADRRLTRAYRDAEAAGVPASTLQQQQTRWKAARAAAAREAPWAVREVYQARIAELQDLARDAQNGQRGN